jgi:putative addiction module killer protein
MAYPLGYNGAVIEIVQTDIFRRWLDRLRDRRAQARIAAKIVAM